MSRGILLRRRRWEERQRAAARRRLLFETFEDRRMLAIDLDLLASSDTGVSDEDNITRQNEPVFQVTVDGGPGQILIDFDNDGQTEVGGQATGPGTYEFIAPPLADRIYNVRAIYQPFSEAVSYEAYLEVTIDTTPPTLQPSAALGALSFDGVDDRITTAARNWGFSTTATVSAWIKTTDPTGAIPRRWTKCARTCRRLSSPSSPA